ncbi:MAG: hypothetical protein H7Z43_16020, partial [Clostridia bacterium]|nr:hypothetical protein [Deltaproteobacteria bacterium]
MITSSVIALALLATSPSPLSGTGLSRTAKPYTPEEIQELGELEDRVREFEQKSQEYRDSTKQLIERKYQDKRALLSQSYDDVIVQLERDQRIRRDDAIARFEVFIKQYPNHLRYTPDAMFRLAELYFE